MPILKDWSILCKIKPYEDPTIKKDAFLYGKVYNHSKYVDGTRVITSALIMLNVQEETAETKSSIYELQDPRLEWLDWLEENGFNIIQFNFDKRSVGSR